MRFRLPARLAAFFCAASMAMADAAVVHMLVPGFTVRELPVRLPNINNLRFAPDGRLTALGYDGRVWLLRDSDGDGLEDTAELFWDQPTLSVPVGMAWSTAGLYVSSHGKVSLLRDRDGDGKAETEEIVASGWPPTDVGSGGVDATAVTLDREGNVYFGLLVADYSNAYRLRKRKDLKPEERAWLQARGDPGGDPEEQVSLYDIHSPRGTIQKWSPRTRKLETIATGIRVPYALAFNRAGDLFNTDQEGETWMPNGNPLDELNHILPGRNYGFPPRHEKWLPGLVSEAPAVAFGPQHQSSCGLVFNEPHAALNVGGWNGSRVKPFRQGKSGAVGPGADRSDASTLPPSNPATVQQSDDSTSHRIGDVPLPCMPAQGLFGPKWWEGNAFVAGESRGKIWRVLLDKSRHAGREQSVGKDYLIARLNMLTLDLAISPKGDLYVCCHSGLPDWGTGPKGDGKIFRISYTDRNAPQPIKVWAEGAREVRVRFDKPLDPSVTNAVVVGRDPGRLGEKAGKSSSEGSLTGPSGVRVLTNEPSNDIEFGEYVRAADRYEVLKPPYQVVKQQEAAPRGRLRITGARLEADPRTLVITTDPHPRSAKYALTIPGVKARAATGAGATVDLDYDAIVDQAAVTAAPPSDAPARAELAGGDYERGRGLFFGERLKCSTCHRLRDEGGMIGPDLGNLVSRDVTSVLRDIREPSASINPDYVPYIVSLNDGAEFTGFIRAQDNAVIRLLGADGKETEFRPTEVKEMRVSGVSLMPTGLLDGLNEEQVRDLLTFLLNEPPKRTAAEVESVLQAGANRGPGTSGRQLEIVLVASQQDHGPGQHDYPAWQKTWLQLLNGSGTNTHAVAAWGWPTVEQFRTAQVMVFYFWNHDWNPDRFRQLDDYLERGGGVLLFHSATIADKDPEQWAERIGLASQPQRTRYLHTPLDLLIVAAADHPLTVGLPRRIHFIDEPYWPMIGDPGRIEVLAAVNIEGRDEPMIWTLQKGKGRIFASILGHYTWTHEDPFFRVMALRGLAWAAGEPVGRFENLIRSGETGKRRPITNDQ